MKKRQNWKLRLKVISPVASLDSIPSLQSPLSSKRLLARGLLHAGIEHEQILKIPIDSARSEDWVLAFSLIPDTFLEGNASPQK
jgi:hypothetical protein